MTVGVLIAPLSLSTLLNHFKPSSKCPTSALFKTSISITVMPEISPVKIATPSHLLNLS